MRDKSLLRIIKVNKVVMLQDHQALFWNIFLEVCQGKLGTSFPDEIAVGRRLYFPDTVLGFCDEILTL